MKKVEFSALAGLPRVSVLAGLSCVSVRVGLLILTISVLASLTCVSVLAGPPRWFSSGSPDNATLLTARSPDTLRSRRPAPRVRSRGSPHRARVLTARSPLVLVTRFSPACPVSFHWGLLILVHFVAGTGCCV